MEKVISFLGMNLRPQASLPPQHGKVGGGGEPPLPERGYCFDDAGRLVAVRYPGGAGQTFSYDQRGNVIGRQTGRGHTFTYEYDAQNRLQTVAIDGLTDTSYVCSPGVWQAANAACQTERHFDARGRLLCEEQRIAGVTYRTLYAYDEAGRCLGVRPPGSAGWLRYHHDAMANALHLGPDDGPIYAALQDGTLRLANGVRQAWERETNGRPLAMAVTGPDGRSLLHLRVGYNARGQIACLNQQQYVYDEDGRLATFRDGEGNETAYVYDARGNRLAAGAWRYDYDAGDRLIAAQTPGGHRLRYQHDEDGNRVGLVDGANHHRYIYDAHSRLTEVWHGERLVAAYQYDTLGRRVWKCVGGQVTILHYDQDDQLLAETDEQGQVRATYLWLGLRPIGRLDGAVGAPAAVFYHHDHLGTCLAITDAQGQVTWQATAHPFGEQGAPWFARKPRDPETGWYDFGARFYDPTSGRFLTPDTYTCAPDDWRLLFRPRRDVWGDRVSGPVATTGRHWPNRYALCHNDPVNYIDLDGHSAWWFFLTIPSSLTWAMPNTIVALIIALGNILMEVLGWLIWFFICLERGDFALKHYPWGGNSPNPFDPDERAHFWLGLDASARLGVPWTLLNGSYFVWRPYTVGNVVFIKGAYDNGIAADQNSRFIVPNDPDVQLNRQDALRHHEMQHVFQYNWLGPLFHSLPVPPLLRLIDQEEDQWWKHVDLGTVVQYTLGGFLWLVSGGHLDPAGIKTWVNPATWWSQLIGTEWAELIAGAWSLDNWLPGPGIYLWSLIFGGGQSGSIFERNAGNNSGDVYKTLVEAEDTTLYIGDFTRIIGADQANAPNPPMGVPTTLARVAFTITPAVNNVGPAAASLNPHAAPHELDLDKHNVAPARVINGNGFYFHSLDPGAYTVRGTGNISGEDETVTITVATIGVDFKNEVFICQSQTIKIAGGSQAAYSLRFKAGGNKSGGSLNGMTYTAGSTADTDTIEVVARYNANHAVFKRYGDNGLAGHDYVVRTFDITVKEPTITLDMNEVFVGGIVNFTFDHRPQTGQTTTNVGGSQFNLAAGRFIAGKGPIAADVTETVTLRYGCKVVTRDIKVKPMVATIVPNTVKSGSTAQVNVTAGEPPYQYTVSVANSSGPEINNNGLYTAGGTAAQVVDTITITSREGKGGRARVLVTVQP